MPALPAVRHKRKSSTIDKGWWLMASGHSVEMEFSLTRFPYAPSVVEGPGQTPMRPKPSFKH